MNTDTKYLTSEVGAWSERKYSLIGQYASMFATSMKNIWDCRVYIDCFCGSGLSRIKKSNRIVKASPILALDTTDKFNKYIFCDINSTKLDSLKNYYHDNYSDIDASFIDGDVNNSVDKIIDVIPKPSKNNKVLSFCVLDPYRIQT